MSRDEPMRDDGGRAFRAVFGWSAPPFSEQFPSLAPEDAEAFDKDNEAIIRLHIRGFLTTAQRDQASKKVTRDIARKLAARTQDGGDHDA